MRASEIYAPLRKRADFRRVHQQGRRKSDGLLQVRVAAQPPGIAAGGLIRLGIFLCFLFIFVILSLSKDYFLL
mgnify:CR=1 FL=1